MHANFGTCLCNRPGHPSRLGVSWLETLCQSSRRTEGVMNSIRQQKTLLPDPKLRQAGLTAAERSVKPATSDFNIQPFRLARHMRYLFRSLGRSSFSIEAVAEVGYLRFFLIRAPVASSMPIPKGDITGGRGPGLFSMRNAECARPRTQ
jgi:hypothetical protein